MKNVKYITTLLVFFGFGFWSCEKKLFSHVEVHGRTINYMTKSPVQSTVELWNTEQISEKDAVFLGSTKTNSDGTFDLKTQADREAQYWLRVYNNTFIKETLNGGTNVDVGNILIGTYTFYCKITLVPISNSAIDISTIGYSQVSYHFNSGTATQVLVNQTYDYDTYKKNKNSFPIFYRTYPSITTKDTTIYVSANTTDTLQVTINY